MGLGVGVTGSSMRIAYQGEAGAYSEAAALKFHADATPIACPAFDDVFQAVETGRATCGVLPIENSIGGTIHRNYDLLLQHELKIVGEVELPVIHCLAALPGTQLADIRQIYSHPQALAQCDRFLRSFSASQSGASQSGASQSGASQSGGAQGGRVEIVATYDTAGSAKLIRDRRLTTTAAIASERAAKIFELDVLKSSIQDYADNITRFLIVTRPAAAAEVAEVMTGREPNKTTVVFTLPNIPGSLFKALSVFALRDIDVTKVESRPIPGRPWEYLFYLDVAAGVQELRASRALMHLAEFAPSSKTLGSYPSVSQPAASGVPRANADAPSLPSSSSSSSSSSRHAGAGLPGSEAAAQ
jgi:arogenate/prephenate dehydratase